MKLRELLLQIGLDSDDSAVYSAMLDLDSVSIRKIADKSLINRGKVYESLKKLSSVGLVSKRHNGSRDYYMAESPKKIPILLQEKRKELWKAQNEAKELIPKLLATRIHIDEGPLVKYFDDDEGVVTILNDVLHTTRQLDHAEYLAFSSRSVRHYLYRKFPDFTKKRLAEGIEVKVIAIGEGGDETRLAQRKWIVEPDHELVSYVLIYGSKVANISISENDTPYGVVIDDNSVAEMYRLMFQQIWSTL